LQLAAQRNCNNIHSTGQKTASKDRLTLFSWSTLHTLRVVRTTQKHAEHECCCRFKVCVDGPVMHATSQPNRCATTPAQVCLHSRFTASCVQLLCLMTTTSMSALWPSAQSLPMQTIACCTYHQALVHSMCAQHVCMRLHVTAHAGYRTHTLPQPATVLHSISSTPAET
jgi:hypothetical protein